MSSTAIQTAIPSPATQIPWEECSCGCHGGKIARIGRLEFVYAHDDSRQKKAFALSAGHVREYFIASYETYEEMNAALFADPSVQREIEYIKKQAEQFRN